MDAEHNRILITGAADAIGGSFWKLMLTVTWGESIRHERFVVS